MHAEGERRTRDARGVITFIALAFGLSWSIEIGLRSLGVPFVIRAILGMYGPAIAAFLVRGPFLHEGFADSGLRPLPRKRAVKWYGAALAAVPICLVLGAALALALHVQTVDPQTNLGAIARRLRVPLRAEDVAHVLSPLGLGTAIAAACTIAPLINALFAFGEEFGWRGYLLPRLIALIGLPRAIGVVGVVWGLWHAPLILLDGLNYPTHRWTGVGMMVLFCLAMSALFGALRVRSGSIWPSTLAHGALNAQASIVGILLAPMEGWAGAPLGICGLVPFALAGVLLFGRREPRTRLIQRAHRHAER